MLNGKQIANTAFVQIIADPSKATEDNPNGVYVGTNIPVKSQEAKYAVIQLMSEGISRFTEAIKNLNVAENIVLANGQPAPLPTELIHEKPR